MQNKKIQEYRLLLGKKTNEELSAIKSNIVKMLKSEKEKGFPDKSIASSYKWQLGLVNQEINRRKSKDRMSQAEGNKARPQETFGDSLKKRPLEDLKKLLEDLKKQLEASDAAGKAILNGQIELIESEIKTRSSQDAKDAKKDLEKAEGKWWESNKDYAISGGIGAGTGLLLGWCFNANKAGWALMGFALGISVELVRKQDVFKFLKQPPKSPSANG